MEAIVVKMFILGKIKQFVIKEIYQKEIVMKGSKGIDKLDSVLDKFWDRAWEFIEKGRNSDNKYIPNFIEEPIQEGTEEVFEVLKNTLDLRKLIEDIVAQGKAETGKM